MGIAIISDIHANLEALEAALKCIDEEKADEILCLGDVVGYGAEPRECITKVQDLGCVVLAGNHDHAAIERLDVEFFNAFAKQAALWTRSQLTEDDKNFLAGLGFVDHHEHFACVHGSLHGPELFNYIATIFDAELSFEALDKTGGNVVQAARLLGLGQATVYRKIKRYRIPRRRVIASSNDVAN